MTEGASRAPGRARAASVGRSACRPRVGTPAAGYAPRLHADSRPARVLLGTRRRGSRLRAARAHTIGFRPTGARHASPDTIAAERAPARRRGREYLTHAVRAGA